MNGLVKSRKSRVNAECFTDYVIELKKTINANESIKPNTKANLNTLLNKLGDFNESNIYTKFLELVEATTNINSKQTILQRFSSIVNKTNLNNALSSSNKKHLLTELKKCGDRIKQARDGHTKFTANKVGRNDLGELVDKLTGMDKLLLALYVYHPLTSSDYNSVKIIMNNNEIDKENYYNVNTQEFTMLENKFIPCKKVIDIINKSLLDTPRKYLIYPYAGEDGKINNNVSPNYLAYRIQQITSTHLKYKSRDKNGNEIEISSDIGMRFLKLSAVM